MLRSPLDNIALAYEPVWDRGRRVCATRLTVHAVNPKNVDITQWLACVTDALTPGAPPLLLNPVAPELLVAMLKQTPVRNTWLEVPEFIWAKPEALELLLHARRLGHQLLWRGDLSRFSRDAKKFQCLRGMLDLSAEDALRALRSAQQGGEFFAAGAAERVESPILAGQLYTSVASRAVADHALDKRQAWGVVGWPVDELLSDNERQPVPMDQRVMVQVMQALDAEVPIQHVGRLLAQDPVVVYRLLRMVNSAAFGLSHEVESIRHALMMLGYDKLRSWLRGAYGKASSDRSLHPVRHGMLLRSRLMHLLLDPNSDEELKGEVQLTGVFAQLDRLMREPLAELLHQLPVPGRIFSTLVRRDGPYVAYLDVANAAADPARVADMPAICERSGFAMAEVNTAILELLATAREPTEQTFAPVANRSKHLA